jgi:hypothetical protein
MKAMLDNIDRKELNKLFIMAIIFIVVAYLFARWLASL